MSVGDHEMEHLVIMRKANTSHVRISMNPTESCGKGTKYLVGWNTASKYKNDEPF